MRIHPILFAALLVSELSIAQDSAPTLQVRMGPRFGVGLATQSLGGLFQNTGNLMPGPVFGWHFDLPIHPQVSITPELLYMTKGFSARNPAQAVRTRSNFRYLELPVLLKLHMAKNRSDGMFLLAGPSLGYFMGGNFKQWTQGELLFDGKYTLPPNGQRMEVSALVGMGMEGDRWGFDVRAQTSVTPFERFTQIQNVVYTLSLAYRFPLKGSRAAEGR